MILELFLVVVFVSFILIILGTFVDASLGIAGGSILFILGSYSLASPLQIHTYDNITYTYTYLNATTGVINNVVESETPGYDTFPRILNIPEINHFFSIILSIIGIWVVIVFGVSIGGKKVES